MFEHLKSDKLVCKALWKYDDWQVSILYACKSRDEANRIEIEEICNFKSIHPNGYNLIVGGCGGTIYCEVTRKKIGDTLRGRKNPAVCKSNKLRAGQSSKLKGRKNPAVGEANKKRSGEKRSGKALLNIQIGILKRDIKRLEDKI